MMDHDRPQHSEDPARVLAGMLNEIDTHRRLIAQRASLGTADMRMLWLLCDDGPRTLRQIASGLNLEQSTVNRQVNAAMKSGLLQRTVADSGAYEFTPTSLGRTEYERNLSDALDTYRAGLTALGQQDSETLLTLLGRYLDAYGDAVTPAGQAQQLG